MTTKYTIDDLRTKEAVAAQIAADVLYLGIDAPMGPNHPYWSARRRRDYWHRRLAKAERMRCNLQVAAAMSLAQPGRGTDDLQTTGRSCRITRAARHHAAPPEH